MDHELAIQNQAVERYVLDEMEPQEREAFEEHFFICEVCATEVRATSEFADEARAIFQEGGLRASKPERRWFTWTVPSFAFAGATAVCLLVIGYQSLTVIPSLKAPHTITPGLIFDGATRSALPALHEGESLHFQMPWDRGGAAKVELHRDSQTVSSGIVEAPAAHQPLEIYFPDKLKAGRYSVVVHPLQNGHPVQESIENQFEVIPQETKTK